MAAVKFRPPYRFRSVEYIRNFFCLLIPLIVFAGCFRTPSPAISEQSDVGTIVAVDLAADEEAVGKCVDSLSSALMKNGYRKIERPVDSVGRFRDDESKVNTDIWLRKSDLCVRILATKSTIGVYYFAPNCDKEAPNKTTEWSKEYYRLRAELRVVLRGEGCAIPELDD